MNGAFTLDELLIILDLWNLFITQSKCHCQTLKPRQLFNPYELQSLHLQNESHLTLLMGMESPSIILPESLQFLDVVIITKRWWSPSFSKEEVAGGDIAVEHTHVYFSLSIFRGNKVISPRAVDVKAGVSCLELPLGFDIRMCVLWRTACLFRSSTVHMPPSRGCPAWHTQGSREEVIFGLCFDTEWFYFSIVNSLHPLLKTKHSPAPWINIVTGSPRVAAALLSWSAIA